MNHHKNVVRIKVVYDALEELAEEVVFVGGATVALYADRPASEVRPTDDVDILVELLKYNDYAEIEEKFRKKGFVNDINSGVICRYQIQGIIVDIMPVSSDVLGFTNRWYADGYKYATAKQIDAEYKIRILSPPYFIATKMEAFLNRGKGDGRVSSDFEDIVFLLNSRNSIFREFETAQTDLMDYLKEKFRELLNNPYLYEWISAHLEYSEQHRADFIIKELKNFILKKPAE